MTDTESEVALAAPLSPPYQTFFLKCPPTISWMHVCYRVTWSVLKGCSCSHFTSICLSVAWASVNKWILLLYFNKCMYLYRNCTLWHRTQASPFTLLVIHCVCLLSCSLNSWNLLMCYEWCKRNEEKEESDRRDCKKREQGTFVFHWINAGVRQWKRNKIHYLAWRFWLQGTLKVQCIQFSDI